jgi:hypothetical protein
MVASLAVPRIDWIECSLTAAKTAPSAPTSASPRRHRQPRRDLLPTSASPRRHRQMRWDLLPTSALPWGHRQPRRDLLVFGQVREVCCFLHRLPLPSESSYPASPCPALLPAFLPWLLSPLALVTLLLLALSLSLCLCLSLCWRLPLWRLPFRVCSSSSSSLWAAAMAAASFRMRKREEVWRVNLCCFPLAAEKEEESVSFAP